MVFSSSDIWILTIICIIVFCLLFCFSPVWLDSSYSRYAKTGIAIFLLLVFSGLMCNKYGWSEQENVVLSETDYDIISIKNDSNYQMKMNGSNDFFIGYISGSANKVSEYVVFEKHIKDGKESYIRKSYNANKTFIRFDNTVTPHVNIVVMQTIKKAKYKFLEDEFLDQWKECVIFVPENAHQAKFSVE